MNTQFKDMAEYYLLFIFYTYYMILAKIYIKLILF